MEPLEGRALLATWDGNQGNGSNTVWSAWSNWNPNAVPQSGDSLVFAGTRKLTNWNNLSLSTPNIIIQSNGFNIDGNAINLGGGGIHFVGGSWANWSIPLGITNAETGIEVYGSRTLYLNDTIYGSGGIGKYGVGTAVLNAANTFTGDTKLYWGALYLGNSGALQGSTVDYNNDGGWIDFGGLTSATFGGLKGAQNLDLANGSGAAVRLTVGGNGQSTTYSGILSGNGGLTKSGGGTFIITNANTYTGQTTVHAGTLLVTGSVANSHVVVSGGTLAGGGSVKSITVNGGSVAPGDGVGTLTVHGDATFTGGTLQLELNDGAIVDQLLITAGDVLLGNALELSVAESFRPDPAQVFALVNNSGPGATSGAFADYAEGQSVLLNGLRYVLHYNYDFSGDGNANDVVLVRRNASPRAAADEFTIVENGSLVVAAPGLLANDSDADGDPMSVSPDPIQAPQHGTVALAADGSFVYTPTEGYSGPDSFTYEVSDGQGGVGQATATITVRPLNSPPVVGTNALRIARGVVLNGRVRATDPDGQTLTYSLVSGPARGQLHLRPDGTFTFLSNSNGTVSFTFAVSDGTTTVQGTATINVLAWNGRGIRPDTLAWMLEHNPGLQANFLKKELPGKVVLLPNGKSLPIYRLSQFLDVNFQLNLKSRKMEKVNFVERQENHMRKLMALPEFHNWIKQHAHTYLIGGKGRVSSEQAYNYFRNINKTVWVTADPRVKAPVGGGNGINGPSWAVWNAMNILFHEVCHVINIGHNSGGLSGPLAGKMDDWDNQQRWNYSTIDLNTLDVPS